MRITSKDSGLSRLNKELQVVLQTIQTGRFTPEAWIGEVIKEELQSETTSLVAALRLQDIMGETLGLTAIDICCETATEG